MELGKSRILEIKKNGVFVPAGCLISNTISENSEMLPTTTRKNNGWATSRPILQSGSIDFVVFEQNEFEAADIIFRDITAFKRNNTALDWRIIDLNSVVYDEGKGKIISISKTASVEDDLTYDVTLSIQGAPL